MFGFEGLFIFTSAVFMFPFIPLEMWFAANEIVTFNTFATQSEK